MNLILVMSWLHCVYKLDIIRVRFQRLILGDLITPQGFQNAQLWKDRFNENSLFQQFDWKGSSFHG